MSTNVQLKLRKKVYNEATDAVNGVVVFDNATGKIYVGGDCFSSEVSDASLNANTGVLTITKTDNSTITVNLSTFEQTSNKVTSLSSSSTDTQYPSAKCVYDNIPIKPVVVWEAETVSQGFLATETDIAQSMNNWQITNLDLSGFRMVELYIRAGENPNLGASYKTPSVIIEIDLDTINKSSFGHFIGSALVQYPNDRNRLLALSAAISEDKTSVIFNRCTSLYGTGATSSNDGGKVLYKIVGYYD